MAPIKNFVAVASAEGSPRASAAEHLSRSDRWALVATLAGAALATLDTAIANTALPAIAADLHATPAASVWVINAYQVAVVAVLLPFAAFSSSPPHRWPARCRRRCPCWPPHAPCKGSAAPPS
jgi:DHA2 family multidrug resistance protein-like MFS transporter